jgi:hypothetical protein
MIINIPLTIDEQALEGKIQNDYDQKFEKIIFKKIDDYVRSKAGYCRSDHEWGMSTIINGYFDRYFDEHKDELVELIVDKIAERAGRYKKVKEAVK